MADDWCTYCSAFGVSEGDYALLVHLIICLVLYSQGLNTCFMHVGDILPCGSTQK